jgi:outer membrane receptor protein involved in Fe transport
MRSRALKLKLFGSAVGFAVVAAVAPPLAQAQAAAGQTPSTVAEIVVTAMKQGSQSVQNVPTSIAVLGSVQLQTMGVSNFADFARSVPGLNFADLGAGDKRYIIRGVNSAGEAQTAVYYDNIPVTGLGGAATDFGGRQPDLDLYDTQQIEVLRGPQGTLYGANSQSGVIRFVTNKPNLDRFDASALADLSDTTHGGGNYAIKGMVNVPIVEGKLAARLVAYDNDQSGFIDNPLRHLKDVNYFHESGGRFSLDWQVDANTTLLGQVFYQKLNSGGQPLERPYDFVVGTTDFPADGSRSYSGFSLTPRNDEIKIYALTGTHDLGWGDLTLAASYFQRNLVDYQDDTVSFKFFGFLQQIGAFPVFPVPDGGVSISPQSSDLFSTEARLHTKFDGPINGVFGLYYDDRTIDFSTNVFATDPATGRPSSTAAQISARDFRDQTKDFAVFGEATWQITKALDLTGGLRYFDTRRDLHSETIIPFFGMGAAGVDPPEHADNNGVIGKVNLSYHLTRDVMAYAQFAQGFRAGGTNAATVAAVPSQYNPDKTNNYELGLKTSWFDRRLTADVAAYLIDIQNLQIAETFDNGAFSGVGNASGSAARSEGVEFDIKARPIPALTLTAGGNYTHAYLTQDFSGNANPNADVGALAVKGAELLNVPNWAGNVSADYGFDLTPDYRGSVGGDVEYTGRVKNTSYDAGFNEPLPSYVLVNLRASVTWRKYEVTLYADNVFDKNAQVNVINDVDDAYNVLTNRPRTVGVRLNARW